MEHKQVEIGILTSLGVVICASLTRLAVQKNGISNLLFLPYPGALILLGMMCGAFTYTIIVLNSIASLLDSKMDDLPGLNLFLPAFIFKTVFFMDWRIFFKGWHTVRVWKALLD